MFAKRLIQKATNQHHQHTQLNNVNGYLTSKDLDARLVLHYGVQSTASVLAFDPIQRLLAIGTLDGRIKVIGGDNIEGLLFSPEQLPYKYLEFLVNEGFLISITNDNDIQIWNLESRCITCSILWESNITAFCVIRGSHFMYIGDENGLMSILKYEVDDGTLLVMPYHLSSDSLAEAVGSSFLNNQPIIGVLPQPSSSGNRVLIAYESGLLILWDISEGRAVVVRGDKVLELKDGVLMNDTTGLPLEDKEISALCWASSSGSLIAVGYVDGDILFWKTSTKPSNKVQKGGTSNNSVVKLQLSSAERRLPIILLQWSANSKSQNDGDGKLFIYGGDEIGCDEVLTVLSLEWNSGMDTLRCVGRVDLTLTGSFADMILSPSAGVLNNQDASVFVLTNPGHLHYFDHDSLSLSSSEKERKVCISSMEYPAVIPTADPAITFSKLCVLIPSENSSKALLEIVTRMKSGTKFSNTAIKWPLTGGVANQIGFDEDSKVERVYVTGYEDGSVRIWDATFPLFSLLCHLQPQIKGKEVAGVNASVSKVDFCSVTLGIAVGNKCGLVRLYNLNDSLDKTSFHYVTETEHEVLSLPQEKGVNCRAAFHLIDSPVQALAFVNKGAKLCVGFECGRVAVIDISSLTLLFLTAGESNPSSPLISIVWKRYLQYDSHIKSPKKSNSEAKVPEESTTELMFLLTKDSKVYVADGASGNMIGRPLHLRKDSTVISMYVIEGKVATSSNESSKDNSYSGIDAREAESSSPKNSLLSGESLQESLVLVCCKDALHLYRTKHVIKGEDKSISKVKIENSCCWTTILVKDERICGLVLLYQTGVLEVRSLPSLELQKETSLMSILRWNFKANMERTMTSTDNGLIALANGYEVAFISILADENDFRIPEYLPCLHDKVLAAATETAIGYSTNQKKKQVTSPRILGGIVKGFKGAKANSELDNSTLSKSSFSHLDGIFSRKPLLNPPQTVADSEEGVELSIDDIIIDEPVPIASTSSHKVHKIEKEKRTERERLFEGGDADPTPKVRTREEIIATYRKAGDASSVAGEARNKLIERQEKLQRISKQTEDLRNGAENFASLANELVKVMESRKWWQKF